MSYGSSKIGGVISFLLHADFKRVSRATLVAHAHPTAMNATLLKGKFHCERNGMSFMRIRPTVVELWPFKDGRCDTLYICLLH